MATTAKPTKVELADGDGKAQQIFLYQLEEEAEEGSGKVTVKFWLDVARLAQVHFKLDLSGSENVEIKSSAPVADHAVEVSCKPFARTDLCAIDLGAGGSLNFTYSWKEEAPDEKAVVAEARKEMVKFPELIAAGRKLNFDKDGAALQEVNALCDANGCAFIDPDFPPGTAALFAPTNGKLLPEDKSAASKIAWRRASDFLERACVFEGGIEPSDIRQVNKQKHSKAPISLLESACLPNYPPDHPPDHPPNRPPYQRTPYRARWATAGSAARLPEWPSFPRSSSHSSPPNPTASRAKTRWPTHTAPTACASARTASGPASPSTTTSRASPAGRSVG
jgi:hypothetical protein